MAEGINSEYEEVLSFDGLTPEQFLSAAQGTARHLGWTVAEVTDNRLVMHTNNDSWQYNAQIEVNVSGESATIKSRAAGDGMGDWNKNKEAAEQFIAAFTERPNPSDVTYADDTYHEATEGNVEEATQQIPGHKTKILSFFMPSKGFVITPLIIDLNILIFILMAVSGVNVFMPDNESLLSWGANFRPYTLDGQWWRLVANFFLHIGIMHLLMNMYALLYIGALLEPFLGKGRFITAYMLAGIAASVTSLSWHSTTISAGASGAIFGMYGVFLAMLTTDLIEKNARKNLLASIGLFVVYNLVYGMKGGVDNAAHIGGLLSGLVIGYAYIPSLKQPGKPALKSTATIVLTVIVVAVSALVLNNTSNDLGIYQAKMKSFAVNEEMALGFYKLPKDAPKEQQLSELKNNGLNYWQQNLQLLDDLDKLKLPDLIMERNRKLRQYCEIRMKSYKLMYQEIVDESDFYDDSIEACNTALEAVMNELNDKDKSE